MEQLPLDRVIRPARLLDLRGVGRGGAIGPRELEQAGAPPGHGDAAVLWTGHDARLRSPDYFWHRPQLSLEGADWLVRRGVGTVAADFPGIGRPSDDRYEVKRALHRGGVPHGGAALATSRRWRAGAGTCARAPDPVTEGDRRLPRAGRRPGRLGAPAGRRPEPRHLSPA